MAVYISTWQIFLLHQVKLFDRSFLLHIMDGMLKFGSFQLEDILAITNASIGRHMR